MLKRSAGDALGVIQRDLGIDAVPVGSGPGLADAIDADPGIELAHGVGIKLAGQLVERGHPVRRALLQIGAIDEYRVVAREVLAVVHQYAQVIAGDLGIGTIQVDHVERAISQPVVGEGVVKAVALGAAQPVSRAQARPAIGAIHELVAETKAQPGMAAQVGNGLDPESVGLLGAHAQRIGVVEAQWRGYRQPVFGECAAQSIEVSVGQLQDFPGKGAGVFRVGVDFAFQQRAPDDAGAAEAAPVFYRVTGFARGESGDFAENHRLGEGFGAHRQRFAGVAGEAGKQQGDGGKTLHDGTCKLRCAVRKRRTNGSLGLSSIADNGPCCTKRP